MTVIANSSGIVSGKFTIPAGIPSGAKRVTALGANGSFGFSTFTGQGTTERRTWQQQTSITELRWTSPPPPLERTWNSDVRGSDPLAQTFALDQNSPIVGIDLFFSAVPTSTTRVQIRETTVGIPNGNIIAEKIIDTAILTGGAATRVLFDTSVTLLGNVEYAIVVLCDDAIGALHVAELGKYDADAETWITAQPYNVGVLLSSSNASTWTPHQDRDMTFRILRADYTQVTRNVPLGNVTVTAATDLILMAYADRPSSDTNVEYILTLPDASVVTVSDGQPVQLASAITGNVAITARLTGTAQSSPKLFPNSQLVAGVVANTGNYVTRAIPAGSSVRVKVIYEAVVPSGALVTVSYKGIDGGDVWAVIGSPTNSPADDGFTEFTHEVTGVTETAIQVKIVLNGTPAARPRVRDLRVIVL